MLNSTVHTTSSHWLRRLIWLRTAQSVTSQCTLQFIFHCYVAMLVDGWLDWSCCHLVQDWLGQWGWPQSVGLTLVSEVDFSQWLTSVSGVDLSQWGWLWSVQLTLVCSWSQSVGLTSVSGVDFGQWGWPRSAGLTSVSGVDLSQWGWPQSVGLISVSATLC